MEWISVKDKLPDRDGEYLCVWRDFADRYLVVNFANDLNKIHANNFTEAEPGWYLYDNYQTTRVTHWMPLPELPKGD